jgi:ribosomal protein L11 methyltransferase
MAETSGSNWTIRFKGYLPVDDRMPDRLKRVMAEIDKLPDSAMEVDEDAQVITIDYSHVRGWFEESKKTIGVVHVGERTVVKPPWEQYEAKPGEIVLEIDPGAAFGSGLHESTVLCVEQLERRVKPGMTAIDFGTGSGILAICAAKLGASRVTAIEADHESSEIARENVCRNGVDSIIRVLFADSPSAAGYQAGLVTANVVPPTLIAKAGELFAALEPGGCLIASGMTVKQVDEVEQAFVETGFEILDRPARNRWVALVVAKQGR